MLNRTAVLFLLSITLLLAACTAHTPSAVILPQFIDKHVGNAGCLIKVNNQLVIVRHRLSGKLGLPAGTAEKGETAQQTAHRETWEETGLEVKVAQLVHTQGNFFLYQCLLKDESFYTEGAFEAQPVDILEITEVLLVDPLSIKSEDWRFPDSLPYVQQAFSSLK